MEVTGSEPYWYLESCQPLSVSLLSTLSEDVKWRTWLLSILQPSSLAISLEVVRDSVSVSIFGEDVTLFVVEAVCPVSIFPLAVSKGASLFLVLFCVIVPVLCPTNESWLLLLVLSCFCSLLPFVYWNFIFYVVVWIKYLLTPFKLKIYLYFHLGEGCNNSLLFKFILH